MSPKYNTRLPDIETTVKKYKGPKTDGTHIYEESKLMLPQTAPTMSPVKKSMKEDGKAKDQSPEDTAAEMQKQMALVTPIMFGMFAYQFPLGLALYWNVFGLFGIMQQLKVNKEH